MTRDEIIDTMSEIVFANTQGLNAALLIGSCAHKELFKAHSDIDFSIWIDAEEFSHQQFVMLIKKNFENVSQILQIKTRGKIAVYFDNHPKMEILIFDKMEGLDKYFLGAEIYDANDSIKFVRDEKIHKKLNLHLFHILHKKQNELQRTRTQTIKDLAVKFLYDFENASSLHYRSDAYRFYFNYNIALQSAIQIAYIAQGNMEYYYLPKKFTSYMGKIEQDSFRKLACSLYLPDANEKKRLLLEYFYKAVAEADVHTAEEIADMKSFLENIYIRDYIWNFRDIATYNPICKTGVLFRSSSFVRYQNDKDVFKTVMSNYKISVIVDLRTNDEISEKPYDKQLLQEYDINYIPISININRSDNFAEEYTNYTDMEKQYRWYVLGNKDFYKSFFLKINPLKDVIMIHCYAGKDRTGVLCALIASLMGESKENIETDYLASELDSDVKHIRAFINAIDEMGGAESFLLSCGVSEEQICIWKKALRNN